METVLKAKDFSSDQDVRWCPGCGDYSILKQVQSVLPETGVARENIAFISGIGCSSRFPYYMNTYGMHSIHGRAPAIASGLKISNPELSVWVITGDGDSLSIGGNHIIHLLRRNFDINVLLFNNQIYGLTKGQYSPTSPLGSVSASSPVGSVDHPFNPLALALGADGTFLARTMDRDPKHLREMVTAANAHKGTSLLEIYQNCNVFNDGAFLPFTEKDTKANTTIFLRNSEPLTFGQDQQFGIILDGFKPRIVKMADISSNDLWIHDETDKIKAAILTQMFEDPRQEGALPRPFGILYQEDRFNYEKMVDDQIEQAISRNGKGDLNAILQGKSSWTVN